MGWVSENGMDGVSSECDGCKMYVERMMLLKRRWDGCIVMDYEEES